jgi:hypothetical protein
MARPARPERSRSARSSRQLSRFYHSINPDRVFGTHSTITLAEAVILKNLNAALQKNPLAMNNIFRLAEASGEFIDRTDAKQVGRPIAVPIRSKNIEEFLAEFGRKIEDE